MTLRKTSFYTDKERREMTENGETRVKGSKTIAKSQQEHADRSQAHLDRIQKEMKRMGKGSRANWDN